MKKKFINVLIILFLFGMAFLICMKSPTNMFSKNGVSYTDSSVFKHIGLSMTQGKIPYLDLFDHKGPLLYFINYVGMSISSNLGVWLLELLFMFSSLFFTYKLARKFTSKGYSLFVTIIAFSQIYNYFEGGNLTEEWALSFQIISLNIFFDFFLNTNKYNSDKLDSKSVFRLNYKYFNILVFICGICLSCILFLRANMISIWFVFTIMVLLYSLKKKKYKELLKFIISFLAGMLIVAVPIIIYLIVNGAFESFIDSYILFNMKYSANNLKITKINASIIFFNTSITILAFIILIIKLYRQITRKEDYFFNLGYLIYMIINLIFIGMSGYAFGHYGMTVISMLIYPYSILFNFLNKNDNNIGVNLVIVAYLLHTIIVPTSINFIRDALLSFQNRNDTIYTNETIEYIKNNTNKNDLISVFGNSNYIYYFSERDSASRFTYQTPIADINREFMDEYLNDLKENKPRLIIWAISSDYSDLIKIMREFLDNNNYKIVYKDVMPIYAIDNSE